MILPIKKLIFTLLLLPLFSFAQKKEIEKPKDSIKQRTQETFDFKYRYYNVTPCNCPTTIELLEKLNDRKDQMKNPYKLLKNYFMDESGFSLL